MKNGKLFLIILGLIVLTLFYVRSRHLVIELSYDENKKGTEKRSLEKKKRELKLELSVLQSPSRIEQKASAKYGLKYENDGFQKKIFMKTKDLP